MKYEFAKFDGAGNDFVMIDGMKDDISFTPEQVAALCDRHFGIGGDGVIVVSPSPRNECIGYMDYYNSDGTKAEMCGNGVRCFTKFLVDRGYIASDADSHIADTLRGPLPISFKRDAAGLMTSARVDMDEPIFAPADVPTTLAANSEADGIGPFVKEAPVETPWGSFAFTCVSMGNPHAVCFLDDIASCPDDWFIGGEKDLLSFDLNRIGAFFESHEVFPAKANVEFVTVEDDGLHMRVFERGCGETLACGTGSCATLVAAHLTGRSERKNKVHLLGGTLDIEWAEDNHVMMEGPATQSFTGSFDTDQICNR